MRATSLRQAHGPALPEFEVVNSMRPPDAINWRKHPGGVGAVQFRILARVLAKDLHDALLKLRVGDSLDARGEQPGSAHGEMTVSVAFEHDFARAARSEKNLARLVIGAAPARSARFTKRATESGVCLFHRRRGPDEALAYISTRGLARRRSDRQFTTN
jgi:hypothetical protein